MAPRGSGRDATDRTTTPLPETDGGRTSLDEILESLANPTRRFVLYSLQEEGLATRTQLAREVAAWQTDTDPDEVPPEAVTRANRRLAHVHLPELAALHFVEYDPRSETVRYADPPVLLEAVLRLLARFESEPVASL